MDVAQKNRKTVRRVFGVVAFMVALSFASVPIYRTLCQVTGWGGRTQRVEVNNNTVLEREITVQFNANVNPGLPWRFRPDIRKVKVKVGQNALITYSAENLSRLPVAGTAIHNVTPLQAGQYFNKTECFCFGEQILEPGQKTHMPVTFFIDPKIMDDRQLRDLKTITLSYTFYKHDSPELEKALKKFYDSPTDSTK